MWPSSAQQLAGKAGARWSDLIIAVARGSLHWRRCLCAPYWCIGGNSLLSQIGRHPAPLFVSANQAASSTSQKIAIGDYEVPGGRDARIFTSALIVQPDLDREAARRGRRVTRVILYFGRGRHCRRL